MCADVSEQNVLCVAEVDCTEYVHGQPDSLLQWNDPAFFDTSDKVLRQVGVGVVTREEIIRQAQVAFCIGRV